MNTTRVLKISIIDFNFKVNQLDKSFILFSGKNIETLISTRHLEFNVMTHSPLLLHMLLSKLLSLLSSHVLTKPQNCLKFPC